MSKVAPTLKPIETQLYDIINGLEGLKKKKSYSPKDVEVFQNKLHDIDAKYVDQKFESPGQEIAEGQATLADLLSEAHELASDLLENAEDE